MLRFATHVCVAVIAVFATHADGGTLSSWNGGIGNWSTATDWSPPVVPNNSPGTGYDVNIGAGIVGLDLSPTINSLTLGGTLYAVQGVHPALTVTKTATINGNFNFGALTFQPPGGGIGSLSVGGDLNIGSSAQFIVHNGPVGVGGNLTNASAAMAIVSDTGTDQFSVGGTLTNQKGGVIYLGNGRCFSGDCPGVTPPAPAPLAGPTTTVGKLVNNGTIYSWSKTNASTFVNNGTTSLIGTSTTVGTLQNGGTLYLSNSCCSVAPERTVGLNVGTGTPGSGYTQFANGVLDEMLSGSSTYGAIIAGPWPTPAGEQGYSVDLNGSLDIMLKNGFVPTFGESFTIITTARGDISGAFSNTVWDSFDHGQGQWVVSYDNAAGQVIITAEPAPEPRTVFLAIPALFVVFWCSRKVRFMSRSTSSMRESKL